ncbi:MAG: hypothetical protein JNM56_38890, partial [Planctomycetia bacterium]|nr:hypothetical protein [Planctomycetia bacterium]
MAQIFNNFWKKYAKPEVKKQWRAKFYQKFESALVTRIDQEDILFNAGIGGEGVCNAMVTDWFARIQKGEKPWETPDPTYYEREIVRLARAQGVLPKEESLDEFVMVEGDQDSAPKKKGDSLEDFEVIEHDKKGKKKPAKDDLDEEDFEVVEHDNQGKPKKDRDSLDEEDFEPVSKDPGDRKEEHETEPESGEVEFEKFTQGHAQDIASKVYQAVESARNPAVFFRLHLRGFYRGRPQGHQLAIYVRILGGDVGEEVPVP